MKGGALAEYVLQHLDRQSARTLSRQLYRIFSQLILDGVLQAGEKLPASRTLAQECGLSRNTVVQAYEQLLAEGYVESYTGSGTFVSAAVQAQQQAEMVDTLTLPTTVPHWELSTRGIEMLSRAQASPQQWQPFVAGVPDVSLFPNQIWLRLLRRHWKTAKPELLTYAHGAGYLPLREALIEHLRLARGVRGSAEQVLLISGLHQALSLTAHLLAEPGMTVWMENPGYWGASTVLKMAGLKVVPIAVDEEGLAPTAEQMREPPRLIFVTPSHQYPLGHVMSLARRRLLLEYAHQHGSWIIEDDYDSEFRFEGQPIASLQGLDQYHRVIYMGTFSKTLFPGMRLGYMVLPQTLTRYFATGVSELYRDGRLLEQAVLCDFITEGHYAAHVRRVRLHYARRQSVLREVIAETLGENWPLSNHEAGLHLVVHLPVGTDDVRISQAAQAIGLMVRPLSKYYLDKNAKPGLLLGYANVDEELIKPYFRRLVSIIQSAIASD